MVWHDFLPISPSGPAMVDCGVMSHPSAHEHRRKGNLYGAFAYASIVLTCFAGVFAPQRFYGSEWMVLVVFGLGGIYAALGVLVGVKVELREKKGLVAYYFVQCAILTAIVLLSPFRSFLGFIVLPLMSQGIL